MLYYQPAAPGGWLIAVASSSVLAIRVDASTTTPDADVLLGALAAESGAQAALELVTANGLAATPPFVFARRTSSDALRCIVRGDARMIVSATEGEVTVSGHGVDTWLEQSFGAAESFAIDFGTAMQASSALLSIETGVVWASAVSSRREIAAGKLAGGRDEAPRVQAAPIAEVAPDLTTRAVETTVAELTVSAPPEPSGDQVVSPATPTGSYDHLFGATVARSVESAAVRPAEPDGEHAPSPTTASATAPEVGPSLIETSGDHDGLTVMSGDLQKLRARRPRGRAPASAPELPPSFRLELADGTLEPIDGPILVGRAPSVTKASGAEIPRLVTVDSVEQDISRNHVRFALEGDSVVVTDLHSRNGTSIILPGKPPQKLRQGEPTTVIADTIVDLGGGVTMTVRQGAAVQGR